MRRALLGLVLGALLATGCGSPTEVREPDLVVREGGTAAVTATPTPAGAGARDQGNAVQIAVVTHGQASSTFWAIVRNGIDAASRQMDASVTYRSPDVYSVARMSALIDEAIASRPDGLVVSIPSPEVAAPIRRAVRAGIPVVSINSGTDTFRRLGVLAHVGQPESRAGFEAGERLAAGGVRHALCINQEVGNAGLDARCSAFGRALRQFGGRSRVLAVDFQDLARAQQEIAQALGRKGVDGALTLNVSGAEAALRAASGTNLILGTFDLSPAILDAVQTSRMRFAVDQQPYLQGYLPIVMLAERKRYGLFPAQGDVIASGPNFVTRETAAQAIRLSSRGIR
jgi:simple sugar transport system substrate-binding protein